MQSPSVKLARRLVGCLLLVYCLMGVTTAWPADRRELWQSRDQFVALESLEQGTEGTNAHPVEIAPEALTALLSAIDLRSEGAGGNEALFTQAALQALAPQLSKALRTATPRDDITFAVIGLHSSLYGLAKSPKVTTGRMFRRDGHLNLIIGMAQTDVNEREDRRLAPFVPGSRNQAPAVSWQLLPHTGQDLFNLKRKDWIVFTDAPLPAIIHVTEPSKIGPPQQTTPAPAQQTTPATPAPTQQAPAETRSPVERMIILNELKNKGLISEEEFRAKRQQILKDL